MFCVSQCRALDCKKRGVASDTIISDMNTENVNTEAMDAIISEAQAREAEKAREADVERLRKQAEMWKRQEEEKRLVEERAEQARIEREEKKREREQELRDEQERIQEQKREREELSQKRMEDERKLKSWMDAHGIKNVNDKKYKYKWVQSYFPLHAATDENNIEIIKILLEAGANKHEVNAAGLTPHQLAQKYSTKAGATGWDDTIKLLEP